MGEGERSSWRDSAIVVRETSTQDLGGISSTLNSSRRFLLVDYAC